MTSVVKSKSKWFVAVAVGATIVVVAIVLGLWLGGVFATDENETPTACLFDGKFSAPKSIASDEPGFGNSIDADASGTLFSTVRNNEIVLFRRNVDSLTEHESHALTLSNDETLSAAWISPSDKHVACLITTTNGNDTSFELRVYSHTETARFANQESFAYVVDHDFVSAVWNSGTPSTSAHDELVTVWNTNNTSGVVRLFRCPRDGSTPTLSQSLVVPTLPGAAVNGNTLVVTQASPTPLLRMFTRASEDDQWTENAALQTSGPDEATPFFGWRVKMSSNGLRAVVSDPFVPLSTSPNQTGRVYTYVRDSASVPWTLAGTLQPLDDPALENTRFGVFLSMVENILVVSRGDNNATQRKQEVFVVAQDGLHFERVESVNWPYALSTPSELLSGDTVLVSDGSRVHWVSGFSNPQAGTGGQQSMVTIRWNACT